MSFAIEMDMPLAFDLWSRLRIRCPRTQSQGVAELCGPGREENPGEALSLRSSGLGGGPSCGTSLDNTSIIPMSCNP